MSIRRRISQARIPGLIAAERSRWTFDAEPDKSGIYWARRATACGWGAETRADLTRRIENSIAFSVLKAAGIGDWDKYDWHLWAGNADRLVTEIVERDFEHRKAKNACAPYDALIATAAHAVRKGGGR